MQFVGKMISSVSEFYKDINPSTLSGAIDVIVVRDVQSGEMCCSPFHVRFGKLQLLRPQEKVVELTLNGEPLGEKLRMKVGEAGETFFVQEWRRRERTSSGGGSGSGSEDEGDVFSLPPEYLTSPLPAPETTPVPVESIEEFKLSAASPTKSTTVDYRGSPSSDSEFEYEEGKQMSVMSTATRSEPMDIVKKGMTVNEALPPASPEWKWEWGDLPSKKEEQETAISANTTATATETTAVLSKEPEETLEFYSFLNDERIVESMYSKLALNEKADFSIQIFRLDRGILFKPKEAYESALTGSSAVFDELLREAGAKALQIDEYASNPSIVVEDARRLVYRMEVEKDVLDDGRTVVYFSGSVGAPLIFSWAAFSRGKSILPLEVVKRLALGNVTGNSSVTSTITETTITETRQISTTTTTTTMIGEEVKLTGPSSPTTTATMSAGTTSSWRSWWSGRNKKDSDSPLMTTNNPFVSPSTPSSPPTTASSPKSLTSEIKAIKDVNNNNNKNNNVQYTKSLRLTSEQLKALDLKEGLNTISYTVTTKLQGKATCTSRIFLWPSDSRIVISDIDGTITKSDALGHLFTIVGKDWTHSGVANLYTNIHRNGYKFLYLTSRAIGQANSTRGYLKGIEQDRFQLPDGPVIMSPDRLFTALHREVIQRRPDEFKIACLKDIQRLFYSGPERPVEKAASLLGIFEQGQEKSGGEEEDQLDALSSDQQPPIRTVTKMAVPELISDSPVSTAATWSPFYSGFGNRPTDTRSYLAVGIPSSRIFIINSSGDLKLSTLAAYTPHSTSSYLKLTDIVDNVFPPLMSGAVMAKAADDEPFTDFNYWKEQGGGGSGAGSFTMELVNEALREARRGKLEAASEGNLGQALLDEQGRPVAPERLLLSATSSSNNNNNNNSSTSSLPLLLNESQKKGGAFKVPISSSSTDRLGHNHRASKSTTDLPINNRKLVVGTAASATNLASNNHVFIDDGDESESEGDENTSVASITSYPYL